jgi:hypothetical protein
MNKEIFWNHVEPFIAYLALVAPVVIVILVIAWLVDRKPRKAHASKQATQNSVQPAIPATTPEQKVVDIAEKPATEALPVEPDQANAPAHTRLPEPELEESDDCETIEEITSPDAPSILSVEDLKAALEASGKTQTELGDAIGVSRYYISKILAGKRPLTMDLQLRLKAVIDGWSVDGAKP